ncbi:hypothetical protein EDD22DRAFT_853998 [Suillus occidentalis]|nr:hypothetical protein EDD22DRAFT_853998 [Suillus occidentalis]
MPTTAHTRSWSFGTKSVTLTPPTTGNITTMSFICASVTAIMLSQMDLDKIKILNCNASLAWNALKLHHEKVGPIAQILLIQQALTVRYIHSECLSTMSTTLNKLVRCIYAIWILKEEDFLTIMMLNAMADDLPHVHNHIADALATSTSSNPYGPSNICSCLDIEQQLIDTEKSKGGDVTLAATSKGAGTHHERLPCGTCGNSSHPTKDCFGKGGAIEGVQCKEQQTLHFYLQTNSLYG